MNQPSNTLKELNQKIWKCNKCTGCDFPSMAGYFPKNLDVLVIGQNPGQLHKRKSGWDDSEYAFNDEDWSKFQQDYAKGLMEAPLGKWLNDGFQGRVIWGLTNIVKCRTESNLVDFEMQANCRPWLQ